MSFDLTIINLTLCGSSVSLWAQQKVGWRALVARRGGRDSITPLATNANRCTSRELGSAVRRSNVVGNDLFLVVVRSFPLFGLVSTNSEGKQSKASRRALFDFEFSLLLFAPLAGQNGFFPGSALIEFYSPSIRCLPPSRAQAVFLSASLRPLIINRAFACSPRRSQSPRTRAAK